MGKKSMEKQWKNNENTIEMQLPVKTLVKWAYTNIFCPKKGNTMKNGKAMENNGKAMEGQGKK